MARPDESATGRKATPLASKPFCSNAPRPVRQLPDTVRNDTRRTSAILSNAGKWLNGTVLHYCFFGGASHYAQPPNSWSRAKTFHNILEKLSTQDVQGSAWDPDSIMEYEFEAGLIDEPEQYDEGGLRPPGTLSTADKTWALQWYPGNTPQPAS